MITLKCYKLQPSVCMYVLHLFLANETRATQKNTSEQQPKIGNNNDKHSYHLSIVSQQFRQFIFHIVIDLQINQC